MKKDKDIQQELEELSPLLSNMKKEGTIQPFQVPEDFFSNLPDMVLEQTTTEQVSKPQAQVFQSWWKTLQDYLNILFQPRYTVGFATIALLMVAAFYLTSEESMKVDMITLKDLSSEEIDMYISQNIEEFQEELLEGEEGVTLFQSETDLDVEDAELEEYLDDVLEEVDVNTLENFL